jgi:L-galactose dehydrogenase
VKAAARRAAEECRRRGSSLAKLALQFAIANPAIATTVAGSANPANVRAWADWAAEPIDESLLRDVEAIFAPVKNIGHLEGLAINN